MSSKKKLVEEQNWEKNGGQNQEKGAKSKKKKNRDKIENKEPNLIESFLNNLLKSQGYSEVQFLGKLQILLKLSDNLKNLDTNKEST